MCGENGGSLPGVGVQRGSSPRVRGKPTSPRQGRLSRGLIPACAGKTMALILDTVQAPAHPRVCGENMRCWPCRQATWGSSPRVRGKPPYSMGRVNCLRLIPACAGKTVTPPPPSPPRSAHPRVCGENARRGLAHRRASWLIPACAGKTAPPPAEPASSSAHPRVCGENLGMGGSFGVWVGSSPRVRGKR